MALIGGSALLIAVTVGLIWWAATADDPARQQELVSVKPPEGAVTLPQRVALPPVNPSKEKEKALSPNPKSDSKQPEQPGIGQKEEALSPNPKSGSKPPPQVDVEKKEPPLVQNLILPLDAVAPIAKLKEIKIVKIKGKVRFTKAANVNDKEMTWESIRLIKYEEIVASKRTNILVLEDRAWMVQRGRVKALTGETLGFYKVFSYGLVVSNLIPLTEGGFETTTTGSALIDGRECFGVRLRREGYPDLTMLFDKKTRLLTRVEFEGRFLDQNGRLADDATRVELRFSDYKSIDGVKHWTKVEQWRDGRKYSEAELSEIQFYSKADPSMFRVPESEAEVDKFYEDKKRFAESLVTFAQSIQRKDPIAAKTALQTLTSLKSDDPGHRKRETALRALEEEILEKVRADAVVLFKNGDYDKAYQTANDGLRIRSSDSKLSAVARAARKLTLVGEHIALASTKRSSGDVSGLVDTLAKIAQVLRDTDSETEGSKLVRQRVPELFAESFTYVLDKAAGTKAETLALLAKKDYVNAVGSGTTAKQLFSQAATVLEVTGDRLSDSKKKATSLELEIEGMQVVITRAKGFVALTSGKEALDAGYKVLAEGKNESAAFYKARAHFQAAEAALAKAVGVPDTAANADLRKAREGLQKVAGLIVPFELDMAKPQDVSKWGKGWVSVSSGDKAWLQMDQPKGALLTPALNFPSTFNLEVDVALVTRARRFTGQSWKLYPDLITVMLVPRDSQQEPLKVSLGQDVKRTGTLSGAACVKINDKAFPLHNVEKDRGQLVLSIVKGKSMLTVYVGDQAITTMAIGSEFAKIAIMVSNGLDRSENPLVYPAVSRISLTALPPVPAKGKRETQKLPGLP
jgi:hypothetical protein